MYFCVNIFKQYSKRWKEAQLSQDLHTENCIISNLTANHRDPHMMKLNTLSKDIWTHIYTFKNNPNRKKHSDLHDSKKWFNMTNI